MLHHSRRGRAGYTLIELLVVIGILAALAALTAIFFPSFSGRETVARGADQVTMWLLTAKQQAKRDGLPTGLRLTMGSHTYRVPGGTQTLTGCIEMSLVQQPDDFAQGVYAGPVAVRPSDPQSAGPPVGAQPGGYIAGFVFNPVPAPTTPNPDFANTAALPVQPGDYIEFFGGGPLRPVAKVLDANTLQLGRMVTTTPLPGTVDLTGVAPLTAIDAGQKLNDAERTNPRTNYRIIPQPRLVAGEQPRQLPQNVLIDFSHQPWMPAPVAPAGPIPLSQNVPQRSGIFEIVFGPSGTVIGQGTGNAPIMLWVRDGTKRNDTGNVADIRAGSATLVVIYPKTGFIAAHPVAPGSSDPYLFARDGRSSGL